jgi:hypothetical protein
MTMRSSGPALAQDATTGSNPCLMASEDWGGLRHAGLLQTAGREPLILAFVSSLAVAGDEADVERIRAEVRGLGVTMLLISHDAVWCFGADDSLRKARAPAEVEAGALRDLFDRLGVMVGADTASDRLREAPAISGLRAVFVIDPGFVLRFAHIVAAGETDPAQPVRSTLDVLLRALVAASVAFESRRAPGVRLSFNELTTLAVVSGMQRVLSKSADRNTVRSPQVPPPVAQTSLIIPASLVVAPVLPWSPRVPAARHASEPGRHGVRTVEAPVPSAHGASS